MRRRAAAALLALTGAAHAESVDFHRPEAWAMTWFTSSAIPTSLGPVVARQPWSPDVGVELGYLPHLSHRDEQVGFDGTKREDLDRSPVLARLRVGVELPAEVRLLVAWIPPVEVEGVRSDWLALALERPLADWSGWRLGARAYGEYGRVDGDITCTPDEAAQPPGSAGNPLSCRGASDDTFTSALAGVELQLAHALWSPAADAYAGVAGNWMDERFQVRVQDVYGRDRTRLTASGATLSLTLGASQRWGRWRAALEGFWTPLALDVPIEGRRERDLLNARALVAYAW